MRAICPTRTDQPPRDVPRQFRTVTQPIPSAVECVESWWPVRGSRKCLIGQPIPTTVELFQTSWKRQRQTREPIVSHIQIEQIRRQRWQLSQPIFCGN